MKYLFFCAVFALALAGCSSRKMTIQATDDFSLRSTPKWGEHTNLASRGILQPLYQPIGEYPCTISDDALHLVYQYHPGDLGIENNIELWVIPNAITTEGKLVNDTIELRVPSNAITTEGKKTLTLRTYKYKWKHALAPTALSFVSGAAFGLNQTLSHHYYLFQAKYPGAHQRFWDPQVSKNNKYEHGDPKKGPAYFGSTTFLVATTDAFHLTNMVSRQALFAAGCTITIGQRRPWWQYAADIGLSYLAFGAGFGSVYDLFFHP